MKPLELMNAAPTAMRNFWLKLALGLALAASFAQTASAQILKVTLLGTGNPRPSMERFGPSILVEAGQEKLLFDCGRGALQRLYQVKVEQIDGLFLTHLHSDHIVGIPDLWLTSWIMGRKIPLRVWGPVGTRRMMSRLDRRIPSISTCGGTSMRTCHRMEWRFKRRTFTRASFIRTETLK
jgi:ribonuclease BN (tRNA processing enzyme)